MDLQSPQLIKKRGKLSPTLRASFQQTATNIKNPDLRAALLKLSHKALKTPS
jgi:hypothetical protein